MIHVVTCVYKHRAAFWLCQKILVCYCCCSEWMVVYHIWQVACVCAKLLASYCMLSVAALDRSYPFLLACFNGPGAVLPTHCVCFAFVPKSMELCFVISDGLCGASSAGSTFIEQLPGTEIRFLIYHRVEQSSSDNWTQRLGQQVSQME